MSDQPSSLAQAIQDVSEKAQTLVREEIELAKAEVQTKVKTLGRGAGVGVAAGLFILVAFFLAVNGLAWLAADLLDSVYWGFFLVGAVFLLLGALAGYVASRALKKGSPPAPQMAIAEAKLIKETVTSDDPVRTV